MTQQQTLWQHWIKKTDGSKKDTSSPSSIRNILGLKIGQYITIDVLDYRDADYKILDVDELCREIGDEKFYSNEYMLMDDLRLMVGDNFSESKTCQICRLEDQFPFDEGFLETVNDAMTSSFKFDDGSEFFPGELKTPACVQGMNGRLEKIVMNVWTFSRLAKDEAGQTFAETLMVRQDDETGWFQLWRCTDVDSSRIFAV